MTSLVQALHRVAAAGITLKQKGQLRVAGAGGSALGAADGSQHVLHFRTSAAVNQGLSCADDISVTNPSAMPANEGDERVDLDSTPVVLLLDACRINATIYLAPELGRFSEAWESVMRDHRLFIPVTGATVTTLVGEPVGERSDFMQVRKTDIRAVSPLDDSR